MINYVSVLHHTPLKFALNKCGGILKIWNRINSTQVVTMQNSILSVKEDLLSIFHAAVSSVLPSQLVRQSLKVKDHELEINNKKYEVNKNCYVVGFGKAVLGMAAETENILHEHLISGILSVPIGIRETLKGCAGMQLNEDSALEVIEGAKNNLPDSNAVCAAEKIARLAETLDSNSILIVLISGGGSALLPYPMPPVTLEEKVGLCKLLVSKGATIQELNCIRKRLSVLKGGGLAKMAYPAQVISLILSDIVGDPLDYIASGPTVVNTDSSQRALEIVQKYDLTAYVPASVMQIFKTCSEECNFPSEDFHHTQNVIVGNNRICINTAKTEAVMKGYEAVVISSRIETSVSVANEIYVSLSVLICKFLSGQISDFEDSLQRIINLYNFILKPELKDEVLKAVRNFHNVKGICLIGGGETTVNIQGTGIGGRNQELALYFTTEMHNVTLLDPFLKNYSIVMLSAGTDGIDGPTDAAGAIGYRQQFNDANIRDLSPQKYLANNDSYGFYSKFMDGIDLIKTGHTGTNVMDIQMVVIQSA